MAVGAGTVLTTAQADAAAAQGADYIVTPGFDQAIVAHCLKKEIPVIPGCVTATEVGQGLQMGLTILKYFPAQQMGGLPAIKLLAGPYPGARFIPTGGITFENLGNYMSSNNIFACGGSYMAKTDLIREENWEEITRCCRNAVDISLGFSLAHIGINHASPEEALQTAGFFCRAFRLPVAQGSSSVFAGRDVECMKSSHYGTKGHLGFYTNSTRRALAYLANAGFSVRKDSIRHTKHNDVSSAYLREEVAGFAVHIMQK